MKRILLVFAIVVGLPSWAVGQMSGPPRTRVTESWYPKPLGLAWGMGETRIMAHLKKGHGRIFSDKAKGDNRKISMYSDFAGFRNSVIIIHIFRKKLLRVGISIKKPNPAELLAAWREVNNIISAKYGPPTRPHGSGSPYENQSTFNQAKAIKNGLWRPRKAWNLSFVNINTGIHKIRGKLEVLWRFTHNKRFNEMIKAKYKKKSSDF